MEVTSRFTLRIPAGEVQGSHGRDRDFLTA